MEYKSDLTTLCYIIKDNKMLMMLRNKKENDINEGKWIGVGGHFEFGESPEECLIREVREETGLTLKNYKKRGIITFCYGSFVEYMHLYTSDSFEGDIIDCDEGELKWIDIDNVLALNIWEGDKIFLGYLIDNEPFFSIKLIYDECDNLVECKRYI